MKEYAAAIIKPDSIRDTLDGYIIRDFWLVNLQVRFRKIMNLHERHIQYIYPDKIGTERYKYALHSISHGPSMLIILEWENDIYSEMLREKWDWNKPWIRLRYKMNFEEDLRKEWLTEEEIHYKLCENRIHTCDDVQQTVTMLSWLLTSHEVNSLQNISISLYQMLKRSLSIQ